MWHLRNIPIQMRIGIRREIEVAEEKKTAADMAEDLKDKECSCEDAVTQEATVAEEATEEATEEAVTEEASEQEAEGFKESGKKESKFGKKEKKAKKDKKDEKIEELTDQVKRQMAEFDNFRKRTEKEKSQMFTVGAKSIIEKILPIVDNFERGLAAVSEEQKNDSFVEGMDKIYKQLMTSLEEAGVTGIEAVGAQFDPELHNAVMHVDDESYGENEVVEEFQKGYKYQDQVVRHSMVKVAN